MGYVLKAVLSSAQHPEYGQITVPFPIPDEKYDRMIELLEPLEIGDALRQDCRVDELDSFYTVLNRLVGSLVNFDELDYLAKRLDSFDDGEAAQFQGMACKLGVSNIKDFINLTFCCQQATVITDFSDLDAIGRQHYMTMQGGGCRIEELERLDGRKFALDLILNHLEGRITPYGVVYDNGMKLEQLYDGRHFPCYHYQPNLLAVGLSSRQEPENISRGKNDPSQSLQMMERPLMTPDELKSMPKGSFIVAKTGVHPMKVKLRLFLDWGIRFGMPYEVPEKAQRFVAYADKQELEESIIRRHYGTIVMDSEQPQGGGTSAGGMAQGIQAAPDSRKTVFRP